MKRNQVLSRVALRAPERIVAHVQPATASLFIVSALLGGRSLTRLFSTHPPMEERVRRLRALAEDMSRAWA